MLEREADVVQTVHQPVAGEVVDLEARLDPGGGGGDRAGLEVDLTSTVGSAVTAAISFSTVSAGSSTGSRPILSELPRKMSANRGAMTAAKP